MENYSYRFASIDDFDRIMEGRLEILFIEEKEKTFITSKLLKDETEKILVGIENNSIIVAEISNKVVGFIWFNISHKCFYGVDYCDIPKPYAFVSYIWVDEKYRAQNIGSTLYENLIEHLKKNNITKIYLDIFLTNTLSINFHTKLGFEPLLSIYSKDI
jgi:ribosomal protein S18 acetylase RimI-like enzyme